MPNNIISNFILICLLLFVPAATRGQSSGSGADANSFAVRKQQIDQLVREVAELTPGTYEKGSEGEQLLYEIARSFVDRNETKVRNTIAELEAIDKNLPPADLLLAGMAYRTNNTTQGKFLLEKAATNNPAHPGIALAFARLALAQGRMYDAEVLTEKVLTVNDASSLSAEARLYYRIAAYDSLTTIALRRDQYPAALKFAQQWEQMDPGQDKMLLVSAEIHFLLKDLDSALTYLGNRSAEKQQEVPTEVVIAKWYQNKDDRANLAKWIQKAYEQHGDNAFTQREYAAWLLRQEDFSKAEQVVAKYEKLNGVTPESKLIKGRIAFSKQDYATAETEFFGLFRSQPNNFELSYLYTLALLETNDPQKIQQALRVAQRNMQLFPNNQLVTAVMGWAVLKSGNVDVAKQLLNQARQLGEMRPDVAFFIAKMMAADNQAATAKTTLEPFMNSPDVFLYRNVAQQFLDSLSSDQTLPDPGK